MGKLPEIHMVDDGNLPIESAPDLERIPEGFSGAFEIMHRKLLAGMPLKYFGDDVTWDEDKVFTILHHQGNTWMSDTPQETTAMAMAAEAAYGDVLVTGLGLGVFQRCITDKVKSCTTLEINPDVVRLTWRHITKNDKRQRLILGAAEDTFKTLYRTGRRFDFIYLDTWDSGDYEQLPWVNWYIRKAQDLLNPGGEVRAWTYEKMVDSLVRDVTNMIPLLKKHSATITEEKMDGLRAMWPLVADVFDWILEQDEEPSIEEVAAFAESHGRRHTLAPGYMEKLSDSRVQEFATRELVKRMTASPVREDPLAERRAADARRNRGSDGPIICGL